MHDTAQVGGAVGSITPTGAVTFTFFPGAGCTTGSSIATPADGERRPASVDTSALAAGSYGFKATVAADTNFTDCDQRV